MKISVDTQPEGTLLLTAVAETAADPASLIHAFVDPALVARWWSAVLAVDAVPGGPYVARFTGLGQTMRGEILAYEPADHLTFTWSWEHEPARPTYRVTVRVDGGRLVLTHGVYANDEAGREDAESHRAGWEYFLPRLLAVASAE